MFCRYKDCLIQTGAQLFIPKIEHIFAFLRSFSLFCVRMIRFFLCVKESLKEKIATHVLSYIATNAKGCEILLLVNRSALFVDIAHSMNGVLCISWATWLQLCACSFVNNVHVLSLFTLHLKMYRMIMLGDHIKCNVCSGGETLWHVIVFTKPET